MQFLRQEARSLQEDLKLARMVLKSLYILYYIAKVALSELLLLSNLKHMIHFVFTEIIRLI